MTRPAPRLARRPLLGSAAVAALAGCGPSAEPRPPDAAASTPGAGDLKDLIVATPILSPQPMTPDGNRQAVNAPNANIYERLTHVDEHSSSSPVWPSPGSAPGRPDVALLPPPGRDVPRRLPVYRRRRDLQRRSRRCPGGGAIDATEGATVAVDNHTVDFTPARPNFKVPIRLSNVSNHVHIIKAGTNSWSIRWAPVR